MALTTNFSVLRLALRSYPGHMASLGHSELTDWLPHGPTEPHTADEISLHIFVPCPFWRKKGGLWNCFHLFVHSFLRSSVHRFVQTKCCRRSNSATTGPIHSKSSSLEPSWPIDVQHHAHLPVGPLYLVHRAGDPLVFCLLFFQKIFAHSLASKNAKFASHTCENFGCIEPCRLLTIMPWGASELWDIC